MKSWLTWVQVHVCTGKLIATEITGLQESLYLLLTFWVLTIPRYFYFALSSAYTPLKSHISGMNMLFILRFAKNYTRVNKDITFDHKIAKFDTRENFRLYGIARESYGLNIWCGSFVSYGTHFFSRFLLYFTTQTVLKFFLKDFVSGTGGMSG